MSAPRIAAIAVLALRIAYGAGLLVAPDRLTARWLGPAAVAGLSALVSAAVAVAVER